MISSVETNNDEIPSFYLRIQLKLAILNRKGRKMNTADLVKTLSSELGFSQVDTKKVVQTIFRSISSTLKEDDVRISGFGTFVSKRREASVGRNPQTGKELQIPASNQAKFRPAKELKDHINA